jgi:DNA-binding NarL/FixJ family response regulator
MQLNRTSDPIEVGLVSDEPLRLEGLISIFEHPVGSAHHSFVPITGSLVELLARSTLHYLVVDLHQSAGGVALLDSIRRSRPSLCVVVIGPEGNDELVLESIIAGARVYLDLNADIATFCQAIEVVTAGSIWAPRRLLSKLIDRLLKVPDSALTQVVPPHLTAREKEVLDLILQAYPNREIARALGIEERTVKAHVGRLMRKTGADNRIELTMSSLRHPLPRSTPRAVGSESHDSEAMLVD